MAKAGVGPRPHRSSAAGRSRREHPRVAATAGEQGRLAAALGDPPIRSAGFRRNNLAPGKLIRIPPKPS
jgi:hypothetical protein